MAGKYEITNSPNITTIERSGTFLVKTSSLSGIYQKVQFDARLHLSSVKFL